MKLQMRILAIAAILLAGTAFSRADIIGTTLADDGDGVIRCVVSGVQQTGQFDWQVDIDGTHNSFEAGHIQGNILTDTPEDPSLTLLHSIDNDTGFIWTDYHVTVKLNKAFTLSNVSVFNPGWTWTVTSPTQVGSEWIGQVDYFAGTPVPLLGNLFFGYTMTFVGGASFFEELIPTTVPEPSVLALSVCGLLGLGVLRRRSA